METRVCLVFFMCLVGCLSDNQQGDCMGCEQNINAKNPDFVKAMRFAVDYINSKSNTDYRYVETGVYNTTVQVVAGFMYRMVLELSKTFCTNNKFTMGSSTDYCPVQPSYTSVTCHVAIWDQDWRTPRYEASEDTCTAMLQGI